MGGGPGVEPEQARAGGGGADRADRGGGVPAAVAVRRVHALADAAEDLQAGDIGVEALPAGRALLLGQSEDGGGEDGGGVRLGRIEIVVEVERVGGGAVDQRGPGSGERDAHADRRRWAGAPAFDGVEDLAGHWFGGAGDGHADDVDEGAVGGLPGGFGPVGGRFGEPGAVGEHGIGLAHEA